MLSLYRKQDSEIICLLKSKAGNRKPKRVLFNAVGERGSFDGLFCLWW